MSTPLVTVCIPVYNGGLHLAQALESVAAQSYKNVELVISDDASTDDSLEIIQSYVVDRAAWRLLEPVKPTGPVANWNRTIREASGDFIKIMGQDDLLHPQCLELQVQGLLRSPSTGMIASGRRIIDGGGVVIMRGRQPLGGRAGVLNLREALPQIVRSGTNTIGEPVSVLMRASHMRKVGEFDASQSYVVDLEFWLRLLERAPLVSDPTVLSSFRISPTSWSAALAREQAAEVAALFDDWAARRPALIPRRMLMHGKLRATCFASLRRFAYFGLRARAKLE